MSKYSLLLVDEDGYDELYTILDSKGNRVGRVTLFLSPENYSEGFIDYMTSRVPVTISMKNDLLKSLREFHPEIKTLVGIRERQRDKDSWYEARVNIKDSE